MDNSLASIYSEHFIMYRGLSYSSCSGQLECLLGTTSKWCCFACTYDSSLLASNISRPQRLYPSSHDQPSTGRPSPLPNFSTCPTHSHHHSHKPVIQLTDSGPPALRVTSRNACTPRITLVPPPCHTRTPSRNVCTTFVSPL